MKFYGILDSRAFFEQVQGCAGKVYRVDERGEKEDLKELAGYLMRSGLMDSFGAIPEINLALENAADFDRMLKYAFRLGRDAA